ncbi:MAG: hypothetical protein QOG64_2870 [Acidimicrobiaceae bacterium]|jgi:tetratricopeptide (TPR) repeat protein|nr:hypothetical protein [Acidimicrobiaceae bacterium]
MAEVGIDMAEIDVDEDASPFKRRLALAVVAITLFGSIVAYLNVRAANKEDVAAREAQRASVTGFGDRVATDAQFTFEKDIYDRAQVVERDRASARRRADDDEVNRLVKVKDTFKALTPLLSNPAFSDDSQPNFATRLQAEEDVKPDLSTLKEAGLIQEQRGWSSKGSSYVAVLTVLAVCLFLLGLSLTVGGLFRILLVVPGAVIAVWCVGWTALITSRPVHTTPAAAIEAVARGNKLTAIADSDVDKAARQRDFRAALDEYDRAIAMAPNFAPAYKQRSETEFAAASTQSDVAVYLASTSPEALTASINDAEKAISLGTTDITVFDNLGANYFEAGRYDEAAALIDQTIALNGNVPRVWMNRAANEVARKNLDKAQQAYDQAILLLRKEGNRDERFALYSGARSDLEQLVKAHPDRAADVTHFEEVLTAAQMSDEFDTKVVGPPPAGIKLDQFQIEQDGPRVTATFSYDGLQPNARMGFVFYFRHSVSEGWVDALSMDLFRQSTLDPGPAKAFVSGEPADCPLPGLYRLDTYVEGKRIATAEGRVDPGVLGDPVAEHSLVVGAKVCRPPSWKVDRSDEQFFQFSDPSSGSQFFVGAFQLEDLDPEEDPKSQADDQFATLAANDEPDGDPSDFTFGGVDGRLQLFTTPDGHRLGVAAFVGSDGTLRVAVAEVTTDFKVTDQLLATLKFEDLAANEPNQSAPELFGQAT